ncbi:mandelate racemase/muconate lactonizing enzyme family protein [Fulvivirga sp. M361]|uniref:mandelate racemase/muconate lactonizing enzyme family protein n=1 Tax=Fulvivirga sp. M361 TaxID=2594266 RepID=UPI00117B9F63|nr:mandelate racemase/muconate lactonizing enzyme family protein [Fulvivirga sp. M361]TRX48561.1 mandelate racemase/muconate lactonizing enzyme family protein [Fulvivirga sp. M361]
MRSRRDFLKNTTALSLGASLVSCEPIQERAPEKKLSGYAPSERLSTFRQIVQKPVLRSELISSSVWIESIGIFKSGEHFFTKVTSKDGVTGISVNNKKYIESIYALMYNRVTPHFLNEDARDLDRLMDKVYMSALNYKWQGLAFWVGVAYVELAILDLLGKVSKKPIGELLGGRVRNEVAIYHASGNRGNRPEEEVEYLQGLIEKSGAKAVKYRLGARMTYDDASTKRDKALIPLVRKTLGDDTTIYTDANGSYDVKMGIEIGKLLEEYQTAFYEEPCRFDHYEETKAVADGLNIPIAGGEEEVSMRQFMWLMDHNILSIVQPDLLFFGGLTRSIKVARMARSIGIDCTPHISGKALGFLYMMHFASCVPNIGNYQEFKGNKDKVPVFSVTSSLQPKEGKITVPGEPGLGVEFEPGFIEKAVKITTI